MQIALSRERGGGFKKIGLCAAFFAALIFRRSEAGPFLGDWKGSMPLSRHDVQCQEEINLRIEG